MRLYACEQDLSHDHPIRRCRSRRVGRRAILSDRRYCREVSANALWPRREFLRPEDLANFSLAFPAGPVLLVKFHETQSGLDCIFLRREFEDRITADKLFGLGEGAVGGGDFATGKADARTHRGGGKPAALNHCAGFYRVFGELADGVHEFLGRSAAALDRFYEHHESHGESVR